MTTALITHADCLDHVTPEGHPEQVARLRHVLHALEDLDLMRVTAPMAAEDDVLRCHPKSYLEDLKAQAPSAGHTQLDEDTWMSEGSMNAAYRAVGAAIKGVDMVLSGEVQNAFAAIRPPGHHAETDTPMGFCLFGNVAIAAKHALDFHGLKRVAVVDFDVHHGNGTECLLWDEKRTLTITSQQMPLWPGTGAADQTGAYENVLNIPFAPESDGATMRAAYEAQAWPRLRAFKPELILISAGFDAHTDDPLAQLNWVEDDFKWLTQEICAIAAELCQGRVVSCLEGGYDLAALARSARTHVEALIEAQK